MEPCGERLNTDSSLTTSNKPTKVIHSVLDAALKTCSGLSPSTAAKHIITVMGKKERLGSLRINSPRLNKFTTELNFVDAMSSTLPLEEQRTGLKLDAARSYLSSMNLAPDKKKSRNITHRNSYQHPPHQVNEMGHPMRHPHVYATTGKPLNPRAHF